MTNYAKIAIAVVSIILICICMYLLLRKKKDPIIVMLFAGVLNVIGSFLMGI